MYEQIKFVSATFSLIFFFSVARQSSLSFWIKTNLYLILHFVSTTERNLNRTFSILCGRTDAEAEEKGINLKRLVNNITLLKSKLYVNVCLLFSLRSVWTNIVALLFIRGLRTSNMILLLLWCITREKSFYIPISNSQCKIRIVIKSIPQQMQCALFAELCY